MKIQMTEEEIKARMEVLNAEISERNKELNQLTKDLLSRSTDPYLRFNAWANNGMTKKTLDYLPDRNSALWKYVEKSMDLGSMRGVVELLDCGNFELFSVPPEDLFVDDDTLEEIEALKKDELFCAACEQMIEGNFDSFQINVTFDW